MIHTTCTKDGLIWYSLQLVSSCWMKAWPLSHCIHETIFGKGSRQHFFHLYLVNKRQWTTCVGLRGYERRYQTARYENDLGSPCSARRIAQTTGSILVKWWPLECVNLDFLSLQKVFKAKPSCLHRTNVLCLAFCWKLSWFHSTLSCPCLRTLQDFGMIEQKEKLGCVLLISLAT